MAIDPMTIAAAMSGIGSIAKGIFGDSGAKDAAKMQKKALEFAKQQAALARSDIAPYLQAGNSSLSPLLNALGLGDDAAGIAEWQSSPLYKLLYGDALQEGIDDVMATASSRGMTNSGYTLKALQDRRMKEANKSFGGYVSGLESMANRGQSAANTSAGIATGSVGPVTSIYSNMGDISLARDLGTGNTIGGGLGDLASLMGQKRGQSLYGGDSASPDFSRIY